MRLLIIGGTVFLGRHIVDAAQDRGHAVTLFNRGASAPDAISRAVEQIHGDREHDLSLLDGRSWDAVIDTCGYLPRIVRRSAEVLAEQVEHYTFVSSISAYGAFHELGLDEDDPPAELSEPDSEDVGLHYGELKAACEREVMTAMPEATLVVRPGLIVGPHDPSERFTYWVRRLAEGGRVLVPDAPEQPVQLIDVRDLAAWIVGMVQGRNTGVFNATGPAEPLTLGTLLRRILAAAGADAELVGIAEEQLAAEQVEPWVELPLWLDLQRHPEFRGFMSVSVARALASGLQLRPLEDTVAATLAWVADRAVVPEKAFGAPLAPAGLSPAREAELLTMLGAAQ